MFSPKTPRIRLATWTFLATLAVTASSAPATLLNDSFVTGDGSGITYTIGSILGQDGGSGWLTGSTWQRTGTNVAYEVTSSQVLRLSKITVTSPTGSSNPTAVARQYADPGLPSYSLSFTLKVVQLTGFNDKNANDYFNLFDRTGGPHSDFGTNATWLIRGRVSTLSGSPYTFQLYNGLKDSGPFDASLFVDSGMVLTEGHTYAFKLDFLGSGNWKATIDNLNDSAPAYTSSTLGFRNAASLPSGFFHIGYREVGISQDVRFELDNLLIPEPGTLALALAGGLLVLPRRRRSA